MALSAHEEGGGVCCALGGRWQAKRACRKSPRKVGHGKSRTVTQSAVLKAMVPTEATMSTVRDHTKCITTIPRSAVPTAMKA